MFTAIHTKKGSKSLASEGVVKPIGLPSESESPKTNLVQEIPETPKASHDRKRRNSLDSTRGLSPRNSKSLSELRSSMCNLEAELIEMRNNLVIYIQRTDTYKEHISLLEDKLVQQDNNNKVGLKQLASRVVDLEVENNAQPRSQGLSSSRPRKRERGDPGWGWSRVSQRKIRPREGSFAC